MQIAAYVPDSELDAAIRTFAANDDVQWVAYESYDHLLEGLRDGRADAVVLADTSRSEADRINVLNRLNSRIPAHCMVVLLADSANGRKTSAPVMSTFANAREIVIVETQDCPESTARHLFEALAPARVRSCTRPAGSSRIAAFIGSSPNVGTTLVSFGTAVRLAIETGRTVGYLCLNLKSSKIHRYLGRDDPNYSLDGLRAELGARSLTRERLRQVCETFQQLPNLHVLPGNLLREQAEYFSPDDIMFLLHTARDAFDATIIEVNAYWDNAATIAGLLNADQRFVVTTPDIAQFQEDVNRWIKSLAPMFQLDPAVFDIVLNADERSSYVGIRAKDVHRETGMRVLARISTDPAAAVALNQGKLLEFMFGKHTMTAELSRFARDLCVLWGLTGLKEESLRGGYKHRWMRFLAMLTKREEDEGWKLIQRGFR